VAHLDDEVPTIIDLMVLIEDKGNRWFLGMDKNDGDTAQAKAGHR
jgi:hypothetical protein